MKKLLSLLLALTMVISLATIGLAADEDKKDSEASIELIKGAFEASIPRTSSISFFTRSGSAEGKSILLITTIISKSLSIAK